jgi:hypothetical protein
MAAITPVTIKGPFATISANGADFTFTAGDTNTDTIAVTGRQVILAQNIGVGARTLTITSVADAQGRTGDITSYSLGAGEFAAFGIGLTNEAGWKQTNGTIIVDVEHAEVKWAVLTLPDGYPK